MYTAKIQTVLLKLDSAHSVQKSYQPALCTTDWCGHRVDWGGVHLTTPTPSSPLPALKHSGKVTRQTDRPKLPSHNIKGGFKCSDIDSPPCTDHRVGAEWVICAPAPPPPHTQAPDTHALKNSHSRDKYTGKVTSRTRLGFRSLCII